MHNLLLLIYPAICSLIYLSVPYLFPLVNMTQLVVVCTAATILCVVLHLLIEITHKVHREESDFVRSLNRDLEEEVEKQFKKRTDTHNGVINDNVSKDRNYLLLLLANSFKKADKLFIEKKHPNAKNVILGFQLNRGNLRFSVPEEEVPKNLFDGAVNINVAKINYNNNYRVIDEIVGDTDA